MNGAQATHDSAVTSDNLSTEVGWGAQNCLLTILVWKLDGPLRPASYRCILRKNRYQPADLTARYHIAFSLLLQNALVRFVFQLYATDQHLDEWHVACLNTTNPVHITSCWALNIYHSCWFSVKAIYCSLLDSYLNDEQVLIDSLVG